jgi:hypothetical protein
MLGVWNAVGALEGGLKTISSCGRLDGRNEASGLTRSRCFVRR